nr:hypothetical protein CFP56_24356 [Quercus suber]
MGKVDLSARERVRVTIVDVAEDRQRSDDCCLWLVSIRSSRSTPAVPGEYSVSNASIIVTIAAMPTYRAAGITATLRVTDLQQSLPANILARHTHQQRQEMKRIDTLCQTAAVLPEKPLHDGDAYNSSSFLRFVGQRGVLMPLLICEAGQHIPTETAASRQGAGKRDEMVGTTVFIKSHRTQHEPQKEPRSSENKTLGATESMSSTPDDGSSIATISPPLLLDDIEMSSGHDGRFPEEPTLASPLPAEFQLISGKTATKIDGQRQLAAVESDREKPQALLITVELSDKTYLVGTNGATVKHGGNDLQIEVFVNGQLAGSCYLNRKVSGVSAVEMLNGRLVFRGKRIHRQVEAVLVYMPRGAGRSKEGTTSYGTEYQRHWLNVSESLATEANSRGWDTELGLAPPSADFLRGLSQLPEPNDLPSRRGLGIIDIVVTAGNGRKRPQTLGHIHRPTWMKSDSYSADNKQIIPASETSPTVMVDTPVTGGGRSADAEESSSKVLSLPNSAKLDTHQDMPRSDLAPGTLWRDLSSAHENDGSSLPIVTDSEMDVQNSGDVLLTALPDQSVGSASSTTPEPQSPKRQKISVSSVQSSSLGEKVDYWDTIAEFDFSTLDTSKIDLAQRLTLSTTRGSKQLTRSLSRCLTNLRQMSSSNREEQVKHMEKILGQKLPDMLNQATRKYPEVTTMGELDLEVRDPAESSAKPTHLESNFSSVVPPADGFTDYAQPSLLTTSQLPPVAEMPSTHADSTSSMLPPAQRTPLMLPTETNARATTARAASQPGNDGTEAARAQALPSLDQAAPNQHPARQILTPSLQDSSMRIASFDSGDNRCARSAETIEAPAVGSKRQSPDVLADGSTVLSRGHLFNSVTLGSSDNHPLGEPAHGQPKKQRVPPLVIRKSNRHRYASSDKTSSPRPPTVEEQFKAITEGVHPAKSSTSMRPFRKVRGRYTPTSFGTRQAPAKTANRNKAENEVSSTTLEQGVADGEKARDFVEAMETFETPEISKGSSVGYGDVPAGFRHTGKARHGEFNEREVVVGFRFCVF